MSEPYKFSFEKIDVWQDSRALTKLIYEVTKFFSDSEKFGLINQMRRASVSVPSNTCLPAGRLQKAHHEPLKKIKLISTKLLTVV